MRMIERGAAINETRFEINQLLFLDDMVLIANSKVLVSCEYVWI